MANYRRRRWRESMTVRVDLNGLLAAAVGGGGLAAEELAGLEPELARVRDELAARRAAGTLAFAELPNRLDDARRGLDDAAGVGADVDALVVLGIGGSALGARALVSALGERPGGRRVIVADSIDPDAFGALLAQLDGRRTLFNVISQSGETAETMAQFLVVRERLAATADWFCQLWAESLGKARDLAGRTVEWGQTPVRALGAADQHSQLQLYVEGPPDKVVLFARVEDHGAAVDLPTTYQDLEGVGYLGGHSLGELLNAEQRATELALAKRGRPSATLVLPAVNAFTLGQLLYLLETATVAVGALAGIDPFGQPGVEEGKRLAYGLMGRPGFEANRAEVEAWLARKDARFIL